MVVCIDERSLAFYALGYGKGSGKAAAVITSSGTAVANLLPAAVEAHESCSPLLLLTADRPPELRDTGANQTINQVGSGGNCSPRHPMHFEPIFLELIESRERGCRLWVV